MRVRWKDFELPTRVVLETQSSTPQYGCFIAEPFERGFGHTIGNSLRRILLSSIEGAAVASMKIRGADHEFTTLPGDWKQVDRALARLNGENNLLGGNTTTAVSIACAQASALREGKAVHRWLRPAGPYVLPVPFFNVINGGEHAGNHLAFQEFMVAPTGAKSFAQALEFGSEIYLELKGLVKEKYGIFAVNVGDEGGFAPPETDVLAPLELIMQAAGNLGLGGKISLAIDSAANSFRRTGGYAVGKTLSTRKLCGLYEEIVGSYPIASLEDPFAEDDLAGFSLLTAEIGKETQGVGDDLLCTNASLVEGAAKARACNCLLLKVNQAGTLLAALDAARTAGRHGWAVMVSHRSGETESPFIAELAVGLGCGQIKSGAPARAERTAKYNQLLRIEETLGNQATYAGRRFRQVMRPPKD